MKLRDGSHRDAGVGLVTTPFEATALLESVREQVQWAQKGVVTFSDAITAVRRWLWAGWVFARVDHDQAFAKLPEALKEVVMYALAPAA